ncbi:hypothetical protein LC613_04080 [Nostoc sphaeroides CHAB 2801]|uniref:Mutator mutT protein n=1 Tax=Nostoc sphaeroides CCNUC1 TaxID=2653204 RepID=A0A5P8W9M8_9NOSO|nr:hypothetical protein [Nostoc sphaeroides]MCC5627383.1 hypothetical protein [Nostoc sphaeroides CHAB 2801]QFS49241.1 Mutator mutT protein [Nostoc sphaeroides CCNUC1]
MTVDGSRVFSQQPTVNSQRLECGIIYFLEFPRKEVFQIPLNCQSH